MVFRHDGDLSRRQPRTGGAVLEINGGPSFAVFVGSQTAISSRRRLAANKVSLRTLKPGNSGNSDVCGQPMNWTRSVLTMQGSLMGPGFTKCLAGESSKGKEPCGKAVQNQSVGCGTVYNLE